MRTIDKILTKVDCRYGAPMGRENVGSVPTKTYKYVYSEGVFKRRFDCKIELTDGYDKGGAYWGTGKQLRVSYTKDLQLIHFYRQ